MTLTSKTLLVIHTVYTVETTCTLRGHHLDQEKCSIDKGVPSTEVIITKILILCPERFASWNQEKGPANRGVPSIEVIITLNGVSQSRGSTVCQQSC